MTKQVWAGIDAGKSAHHCVVIDTDGKRLLSKRIDNDEPALITLIAEVADIADSGEVTWAMDLNSGGGALLIALLVATDQTLLYIPGRTVYHASAGYRGDGKSDSKDAAVIADQARMRRDLQPLRPGDEVAVDLRILTARRADLVADRTRAINRLRALLVEIFPALERAFDYSASKAALTLLTGYQTPAAIRRLGRSRLEAWLRNRKVRNPSQVADAAYSAAQRQHMAVAGEQMAAAMISRVAKEVITLDAEISETESLIEERFRCHEHAAILTSMPGFGVILAAEFLANTGGDLTAYDSVNRLAGVAGLAPVPRDSGRISGNLHRPRHYNRRLLRSCYLAAQIAARTDPISMAYYQRKRGEGKTHVQAVLALARRRLNVQWAMLRDHTPYTPPGKPTAATAA